jgi:hypothetical protein
VRGPSAVVRAMSPAPALRSLLNHSLLPSPLPHSLPLPPRLATPSAPSSRPSNSPPAPSSPARLPTRMRRRRASERSPRCGDRSDRTIPAEVTILTRDQFGRPDAHATRCPRPRGDRPRRHGPASGVLPRPDSRCVRVPLPPPTDPSHSHVRVKSRRPAPPPRLAARPGLPSGATPAEERGPADGGPMRSQPHRQTAGFVENSTEAGMLLGGSNPAHANRAGCVQTMSTAATR